MRKNQQAAAKVFRPPSQMNWSDEKLAQLSKEQLISLFENLKTQREEGRVSEEAAHDLARRIAERLPARALQVRRKRPHAQVQLEAQVAAQLGGLASALGERYDLSVQTAQQRSAGTKGFRAQALTERSGSARTGGSVKRGHTAIDRYIAYRVRDSLAGLAFVLFPDQPTTSGRYLVLGTDDLLEGDAPADAFAPLAEQYGWSRESRARLRMKTADSFAEAEHMYEALIARVAAPLA
jgi:hypothetical protein